MSELDLPALRAVADAATQGEWTITEEDHFLYIVAGARTIAMEAGPTDATHIATFDPPTVLRLLGELEMVKRDRDAVYARIEELEDDRTIARLEATEAEDISIEWRERADEAEAALAGEAERLRLALRAERECLAEKISILTHHCFWLPDYGYMTPNQEAGQRLANGLIRRVQNALIEEDRRQDWKDKQDALRDAGEPFYDWRAEEARIAQTAKETEG